MADTNLTISATNVLPQPTYGRPIYDSSRRAGSTITAGTLVYLNASSVWAPTDTSAALSTGFGTTYGIAANGASVGQLLTVQTSGGIQLNTGDSSGIVIGAWYRASMNGTGGIADISGDAVDSGDFTGLVGYGVFEDIITMFRNSNGVAHA
jgi:hypothetical protein